MDKQTVDKQTSDKQTSDKQTSDKQTMTSQPNDFDHISILLSKDNTIYGKVIHAESAIDSPDEIHVVTDVWLGPYYYEAVYATNSLMIRGQYMPFAYELSEEKKWLFYGTFTRISQTSRYHFPGRTFNRAKTHRSTQKATVRREV